MEVQKAGSDDLDGENAESTLKQNAAVGEHCLQLSNSAHHNQTLRASADNLIWAFWLKE